MIPNTIDPMLAQPSRTVAPTAAEAVSVLQATGLWSFEMKWDGARMIAFIRSGSVRLKSRDGNDTTYRYPEVVAALQEMYADVDTAILDGEIVVFGPDGRPSFPLGHRRDAQGTAATAAAMAKIHPARFMVFDILWMNDTDVRGWEYLERQTLLATEQAERFSLHPSTVQYMPPQSDGETMWRFVNDHQLEGLVAKKNRSTYRSGRSHFWVKLKPVRTLSALVRGHTPGSAAGALELALLDGKSLKSIGRVGSGLTTTHLDDINRRVAEGAQYIVVEVQYMEVSPNGQLRHPVMKGLRDDVPLTDCNISQLEG